jgi:hypothetical protein
MKAGIPKDGVETLVSLLFWPQLNKLNHPDTKEPPKMSKNNYISAQIKLDTFILKR